MEGNHWFEQTAADVVFPAIDEIAVIAVSAVAGGVDLSDGAQLGALANQDRLFTFQADTARVSFFLNTEASGTPDPTATSGSGRCYILEPGQRFDGRLNGRTFVRVVGDTDGFLRVFPSSELRQT